MPPRTVKWVGTRISAQAALAHRMPIFGDAELGIPSVVDFGKEDVDLCDIASMMGHLRNSGP